MKTKQKNPEQAGRSKGPATFKIGAVCLVFLVIGYQAALFINRAAVLAIEAKRDKPDTVYIVQSPPADRDLRHAEDSGDRVSRTATKTTAAAGPATRTLDGTGRKSADTIRRYASHSPRVSEVRKRTRAVENFRFNPNTASLDDFMRLGFSEKQAQSIISYREKGGRFRRKSDFAKSFVVADSVYRRLEPWIDIPRLDINKADSAAFDELPGIGPYFAAKMVEQRKLLGGYSYPEQLMDIYNFDEDRYASLKDLVFCSEAEAYPLWTLPAEELRRHPYIGNWQTAKAIVLYREHTPRDMLSVEGLVEAGILEEENGRKLALCRIAEP